MKPPTLSEMHTWADATARRTRRRLLMAGRSPLTPTEQLEINCADTLPVLLGWLRNVKLASGDGTPLEVVISSNYESELRP